MREDTLGRCGRPYRKPALRSLFLPNRL